jgi:hypothetical protein
VMVALTLASIVVLIAHQTFAASSELAARLRDANLRTTEHFNAMRLLTAAIASIEIGPDADTSFQGSPHEATFSTWLASANAASTRTRVTLTASDNRLLLIDPADTLQLFDAVDSVDFDYLMNLGGSTPWISEWRSPVTAPLAVRIRLWHRDSAALCDTLLIPVGSRG